MGRSLQLVLPGIIVCMLVACQPTGQGSPDNYAAYLKRNGKTQAWNSDVRKGFTAYHNNRYAEAYRLLNQAQQAGCRDPLVAFTLASILDKQDKRAEAEKQYLEIAAELEKAYPDQLFAAHLWAKLARLRYLKRDVQQALAWFEKAYTMGLKTDELLIQLSIVYLRLKRYSLAAAHLEKVARDEYRKCYYLGRAYYRLGMHDAALKQMELAVAFRLKSVPALGALANIHTVLAGNAEKEGRKADALRSYSKAIKLYQKAILAGGDIYKVYLNKTHIKKKELQSRQGKGN